MSKARLDTLLVGCFAAQKLYGRDPGSLEAVNQLFHAILGKYPSDKVLQAFEAWLERSQEFPTPADIVGLIKRKGKPPLTESQYIAISKKSGEDRTPEEWQYLRDYEAERDGAWDERPDDEQKRETDLAETIRLRKEILDLKTENRRLAALLHEARMAKGEERPEPSEKSKVLATIEAMRAGGAPEADIEEFAKPYGGLEALAA